MPQATLQLVFRSTALAKLLYAAPAWWGFAHAGDRNRLEGFLRRAQKAGYYNNDSLPTVAAHCEQADEQLFSSLQYCYIHPLRRFLPPERNTPYDTRSGPHDYYLPQKFTSLDECNYMFRVLYKHCYWLACWTFFLSCMLQRCVCRLCMPTKDHVEEYL